MSNLYVWKLFDCDIWHNKNMPRDIPKYFKYNFNKS